MTKELIAQFTGKLLQYAESAEMFAKTEVPKYITELLQYKLVEGGLMLVILIILLILSVVFALKAFKSNSIEVQIFVTGILGMTALFLLFGTLDSASRVIKISVAPRVFIVDYLRSK